MLRPAIGDAHDVNTEQYEVVAAVCWWLFKVASCFLTSHATVLLFNPKSFKLIILYRAQQSTDFAVLEPDLTELHLTILDESNVKYQKLT